MGSFQSFIGIVFALGALMFASSLPVQAQARGAWVEVKGTPAQIDQSAGTFMIESLLVTTTPATRYEDRNGRHVDKAAFFADLHETDRVEVEGNLEGKTIAAREIEIKRHR